MNIANYIYIIMGVVVGNRKDGLHKHFFQKIGNQHADDRNVSRQDDRVRMSKS